MWFSRCPAAGAPRRPSRGLARAGLHVTAVGADAFAHAGQAAADARRRGSGASRAVVVDVDAQLARLEA
jgi:hypothetical protein